MTQHEKEPKDDTSIGPIRRGKFSIQNRYFDFHGPVFWTSSIVALTFIVVTLALGSKMDNIFSTIQGCVSFRWRRHKQRDVVGERLMQ